MSSSAVRQSLHASRSCRACLPTSSRRWASSSSSSRQPEHKAQRPLLPGGRLPAKDLRKLVELHHLSASFITPETLDASISKAFSRDTSITRATDDDLRALASARVQAQLDSGEAVTYAELSTPDSEGPQRNPRLERVANSTGQRDRRRVGPLDILGFAYGRDSSVGAAARADLEYNESKAANTRSLFGDQFALSDGKIRGSVSQADIIRTDRERRLREAMTGVVETRPELAENRNEISEPGLEKVLEYVKENGEQ